MRATNQGIGSSVLRSLVGAGLLLGALPAQALDVFINNVKVTGALRGQELEVKSVRFADNGDIYVNAPGYKIETAGSAPATPPPTAAVAAANRVWLVVNNVQVGHYTIKTQLNGLPLADVPPERTQFVVDVTDKLQPGPNRLTATFLPQPGAPAMGMATEAVTVMVGLGDQSAEGTLTIARLLGTIKHETGKKAAEQRGLEFSLSVQ